MTIMEFQNWYVYFIHCDQYDFCDSIMIQLYR